MSGVQPTEFLIIENGGYVKYLREGECNLCGLCCCKNVIGVRIEACLGRNPDGYAGEVNWEAWDGYSHFQSQGMNWWVKFDVKDEMQEHGCSSLVDGKCSIWKGDEFPAVCRHFPVHPRDIEKFHECGFSFRRVDDD